MTPAQPPAPAPPARAAAPILLQVNPDRIEASRGPATISVFITDLTPGGSLEADLDEPGGGTYAGESASADSQGDFTFSPRWPPHFSNGGLTPTGNYRIVIRDQTAGATATAILQVAP